jgi:hypothetical protein
MSFDHDRPSKWFNPGDVVHYSMMKTWLGEGRPTTSESLLSGSSSRKPMNKASKCLFLIIALLLLVCGTCSIVTQIVGYH